MEGFTKLWAFVKHGWDKIGEDKGYNKDNCESWGKETCQGVNNYEKVETAKDNWYCD